MPRPDRLALAFRSGALEPPEAGDVLVLRGDSAALAEVVGRERLIFEASFRPDYDRLAAAGLRVTQRATSPAAMAVVVLGRARAESLGAVARALGLLSPGAILALDGARTDGVDSLARQVASVLPQRGAYAKAHGRAVWFARPETLPPEAADWAAAAAPAPNAAGFVTEPGLFSPDGPDPGSRRLAEALGAPEGRVKGRVADLGAGWGWLAYEALRRCPGITSIDLYEAEARALDAARANLPDSRAAFHWADVATLRRAEPPHDAVIANPPFHAGRAAEPALGRLFVSAAARLLKPSGRFLMVANRHLPYEAALDAAFARWAKLSEDGAFKVIAADRPRRV